MSSLVESPEYLAAARFAELAREKRALQDRLDEVKRLMSVLEPALVGYLSAAGLPQLVVGDDLLYTQREPWVYPVTGVSRQMVCEALKISGLGRMVTENYSTQSLTSYVKNLEDHHNLTTADPDDKVIAGLTPDALQKLLPPALAHVINVKAAFHVRVKKRGGRASQFPAYPAYEDHEGEQES